MNNRKKIIVSGASGFLGTHLLDRLKDDKRYLVFALSSRPEQLKEKVQGANLTYLQKDSLFNEDGREILRDSFVINCAYPRNSSGVSVADGLKYIQRLFVSAVVNGAEAIINVSSQSVYSQHRTQAATEKMPICPESPYAVGKYAVELMLESICAGTKTNFTNIRLASLIGPGFDQRIVNRFAKQALESGTLTVKRNGQRFGFFDVEDAVSGLVGMLESEPDNWKVAYNLGRDEAYTIEEIAKAISSRVRTTRELSVQYEEDDSTGNTGLDCRSFYNDFGFHPSIDIETSIERIFSALTQ